VAPVFPAHTLNAAKTQSLQNNEINYMFCLPTDPPDLPEILYSDLSVITAVHKSYLRQATLVRRLTALATFQLQKQLARLHGRPFGFGIRDRVPVGGGYVCFSCFIRGVTIQRIIAEPAGNFPSCPGCGDEVMWLKLP
jgi:hypothetical protein